VIQIESAKGVWLNLGGIEWIKRNGAPEIGIKRFFRSERLRRNDNAESTNQRKRADKI
jgi:hypothetical protein